MHALQTWQTFYVLMGTAAATLIGLLFVAISIGGHLPEKRAMDYLQTFVNPTLLYYIMALLVSFLAIMPLQNDLVFSVALVILGSIILTLVFKVVWRIRVVHHNDNDIELESEHLLWHIILPFFVGLLFLVNAIAFLLSEPFALLGLAVANLLCLAIGLHNTWTLTIWLTLHRGQASTASSSTNQEEM